MLNPSTISFFMFSGRFLLALLIGCALVSPANGQLFRKFGSNPFKKKVEATPVKFKSLPSQQELLASLQVRTTAIKQLKSRVTVDMAGAPKIKGTFQVEFPNRLRMQAGVMGASEFGVDVGSNERDFWIWSKASLPGQPPAFYFANHAAFARSPVRQSIPLEPKWLIEALGLIQYASTDVHVGPTDEGNGLMKLTTIHQTPTGEHARVTLLSKSNGLIVQQAIYGPPNPKRERIAYSNSADYKYYPEFQTSLPQKIQLFIAQPGADDLKIEVDLGTYSVNALFGEPAQMWGMPDPGKDKTIDLTKISSLNLQPQRFNTQQQRQNLPSQQSPRTQRDAYSQGSGFR